jgi:very-short-patch-repair endonuclease
MLKYNPQLKTKARTLRITLTDAEQRLTVLRFDDRQVLLQPEIVAEEIFQVVKNRVFS